MPVQPVENVMHHRKNEIQCKQRGPPAVALQPCRSTLPFAVMRRMIWAGTRTANVFLNGFNMPAAGVGVPVPGDEQAYCADQRGELLWLQMGDEADAGSYPFSPAGLKFHRRCSGLAPAPGNRAMMLGWTREFDYCQRAIFTVGRLPGSRSGAATSSTPVAVLLRKTCQNMLKLRNVWPK